MPNIQTFVGQVNLASSGAARFWNISGSISGGSPSILLNTQTGELVEHWLELDYSSDDTGAEMQRTLIMWPSSQLNFSTRYIVAYRSLVDDSGIPLEPSDGFAALRDGVVTNNPALEASRTRFEAIFKQLGGVGWERQSLVQAWDFTTASRQALTGRFVSMRDDAFARIDNGANLTYTINQVINNPTGSSIARTIYGTFNVPLYLNTYEPGVNVRLVINPATGLPVYQGMAPVNFTVLIPASLAGNATMPPSTGKVVQYGHGLFGDQSEVETGYLDDEANAHGYVLGAVDWWGLCEQDVVFAALIVAEDLTQFGMIPDRGHQGMLNALLLMKLMTQSSFATDPAVTFSGVPVISRNQSDWHYYGNSQGGIFGSVYMAVSTDVLRGTAGVPGGPYGLLLPRSADFTALFDVAKARYASSIDRIAIVGCILQALFDRMEPSSYMRAISIDPLPNTPRHTVVWNYGLGDAQVTWLGAQMIARSAGASMFVSNVREGNETLTGFNFVSDSTVVTGTGNNVIQGFAFVGTPDVPFINIPANKTWDAHEKVRRTPTAIAQMATFFWTGEIINTCGGPCISTNPSEYL